MKVLFRLLACLAVLLAALVLGRNTETTSAPENGATTVAAGRATHRADVRRHAATSAVHVRAALHAATHHGTAIDDDDDFDDDDAVESGILAPERRENDSDTGSREVTSAATQVVRMLAVASMHSRRRGLRPSGEHRVATDRPPRA